MTFKIPRSTSPGSEKEPATYKSLALAAMVQELEPGRQHEVLDLGSASAPDEFWARLQSRVQVADFFRTLNTLNRPPAEAPPESQVASFEAALSGNSGARFDLILAWDLFNYFERETLERFIHHLNGFCKPGTMMFALFSMSQRIPAEPINFRILDQEHLVYEVSSAETRPCPRYQPRDISIMMKGFHVLQSFILRNGMLEYLFVHD